MDVIVIKRDAARQHFVEHGAQAVDVGAPVPALALDPLEVPCNAACQARSRRRSKAPRGRAHGEIPKSINRNVPSSHTMMLSGFKSR